MQRVVQSLSDILANLKPLTVDWQDPIAIRVIEKLKSLPVSDNYTLDDIGRLLDHDFEDGLLICRLFLGLSKDQFTASLVEELGDAGAGKSRFKRDRSGFLGGLAALGVADAMVAEIRRKVHWSDTLVERLRSGRGSAISGQRRGRGLEDFAEEKVQIVFGKRFASRSNFVGVHGQLAKCDIAIPSMDDARIVIESKAYGATGSKMTDVIGDIEKIIAAKRSDTAFLFVTDGLSWRQRQSDLRKIVSYQNNGDITRIYTLATADQFVADLEVLKNEMGIV
ncbi:DpnII family type II restriction endonuclease [Bradyrhizobium diazoefficiens]|uniref:DpnII family type II restriction endonuclease n=1 Tax=Bradyrhizobium diazoefficiens TaxID=1355477 RepID=UPI00383252A4